MAHFADVATEILEIHQGDEARHNSRIDALDRNSGCTTELVPWSES